VTEWTELTTEIVDRGVYDRAVRHLRQARVVLPTFAQLSDPRKIPAAVSAQLDQVDPDAAHAANLFRVHWHNDAARRGTAPVPIYLDLPEALTGVKARILVALARHFPMISAHKVLAAYGCLAPRIVTGQFDPERQKAVWPSTGNYCRGGVAISRILDCRGVAILPEGMSRERFDWLQRWVRSPDDIVRTPGTESNVKEIYDACHAMARDPANVILNQFSEFGNYLAHYVCTGPALRAVFEEAQTRDRGLRLSAFVAASGSAGTLGAGDYLKTELGAKIVAVEAVECPTMLYNGYGEHNIQGIGDKHIPFIHNVMNTDVVVGISDRSTDALNLLLNSDIGKRYLAQRQHLDPALVQRLDGLGLSSIANVLAAIKTAKRLGLGSEDAIVTVATDGAAMYGSEIAKAVARYFGNRFDAVTAGETWGRALAGASTDHLIEMTQIDRRRVFNLGYFTWVEQQGVSVEEFSARAKQSFWNELLGLVPAWDAMIADVNAQSGAASALNA